MRGWRWQRRSWNRTRAVGGMVLNQVRAVFFDLDNTLIDTAGASRKAMLEVTSRLPRPSSGQGQCAHPVSRAFLSPWCLPTPDLSSAISAETAPGPGHPGGTGFSSFEAPGPMSEGSGKKDEWAGGAGWCCCLPSLPAPWVTCLATPRFWDAGFLKLFPVLWDVEGCH